MVKYKSLIQKYCCSSVDGQETSYTLNISEPEEDMSPEQKTEENKYAEYVPSWRAPCDAWVTANVVDCTGVNTPVFVLYNAYINDNPNDYMDIGQFGKVLRSRFPYRKRRRGKQGQQVYVYQDVALKNKDDSTQNDASTYQPTSEDPKHPNTLQQMPIAGPSIVVGNNAGGRLLSSPQSFAEVNNSLSSSPGKRKEIESFLLQSPSNKRLKVSKDITIPGPNSSTLCYQSSFSPHFRARLMGHPKQSFSNDQNEDIIFKNIPEENTNSEKLGIFYRTKNKTFDYYSPNSGNTRNFDKIMIDTGKEINLRENVMNVTEKLQSGINSKRQNSQDHGFKTKNLSSNVMFFKEKNHPIKNNQNLIFDLTLLKQNSANTEFIDVPSGSAIQQNTDTNQHSKDELLDLTAGDENYTNTNLCRMSIGRRWIDGNLIDMVGIHTYANDICQAYAQDHPDQPLNFTSLAVIIRGKYPGRRRKVIVGSETRYLYQNIKLIRNQGESFQSLEKELSSFSTGAAYESTTHKTIGKQIPSHSNRFVALPVSRSPTTATNLPANSFIAYVPVLKYQRGQMGTSNSTLVTHALPSTSHAVPSTSHAVRSTSYAGTKQSDIPVTQRNMPNLEVLLPENDKFKLSPNYQEFGSNDNRNKDDELYLTNQEKQTIEDGQKVTKNSQSNEDMNVSDYLEHELLDINDMSTNVLNYKVTIQVPSSKQVKISDSNPTFRKTSKMDLVKNDTLGFERHLVPPSDDESVSDTSSSSGESQQCSSLTSEKPTVVDKKITSVVKEMTNKSSLDLKQSWDYRIRKGVGPEPTTSLAQNNTFCTSKNKINNNRKGKMPKIIISKKIKNASDIKNKSESLVDNPQRVMEKFSGTSRESDPCVENKECSNTNMFKGNGGSPTSTSPPCSAMNRLAEEIDTSTPYVARSLQQTSVCSSSTSVQEPTTNINSVSKIDPRCIEILRSIILTAQKTLCKPEEALNQALVERKLERAVIAKNLAVFYEESTESDTSASNADSYPCSVMPDLKELVLSSPEHVNGLLRHHQACPGLGCSKECQTLRAAYVHIATFHHRCQISNAFSKIISKHSRPCRVVSCGVEFCHFVKHELHLNGVSVLPMQLLKERPTLEEEFKNCENIGTHDGDLHCRHMQCPKLPVINASEKQLKNDDVNKEAQNIKMNNSSLFPDTPIGNALAVPVMKTIRLVRDLFRKSVEVD